MPDSFTALTAVFLSGLYAGLLKVCYGPVSQLLSVVLLNIYGLPPVFAASVNLSGNLVQTVTTLTSKEVRAFAHRRLGISLGLFGIIGMFLGHSLLTGLSRINPDLFSAGCLVLLCSAGVATILFSRQKEKTPNSFPSGWPCLFRFNRGNVKFIEFLSLPGVFLAGLGIGFGAGFFGLGAGLVGVILLAKLFQAPPKVALATDCIASVLIGTAAFGGYLATGHLEPITFLLFATGLFIGSQAGNLAPPEIKAGMFRPAFGGLLFLAAAALALKMVDYTKVAGLLLLGSIILLIAALLTGHLLTTLRAEGFFHKETGGKQKQSNHSPLHP